MPSLRKLRAGRIPGADASTWVGDYGTIFYNEATGTLRISDGETPGGNPLTLVSSDFAFTFGDFVATTPEDGSASLSSLNDDQDINIYSNGNGAVNIIGTLGVYPPDGDIYSRDPVFRIGNDGQLHILVSQLDANEGAVEIIGSTAGTSISPGQTGTMLHTTGQINVPNRTYLDGNGDYVSIVGRRWNGTIASPTQVLANDYILRINATAHTNISMPNIATGQILFKSLENQTATAQGSSIEFVVTPIGQSTTNRVTVATIDNANGITATKFTGPLTGNVTGNVSGTAGSVAAANITGTTLASNVVTSSLTSVGTLGSLSVTNNVTCKGIINTPVNNGSHGTNFNIDLSAGDLQIVNITANNLVITLQNATAGKVTTLIIKSNGNYTITHGVSAANTSSNSTTVSVNNRSVTLIFSQFGTTIATDVYLGIC